MTVRFLAKVRVSCLTVACIVAAGVTDSWGGLAIEELRVADSHGTSRRAFLATETLSFHVRFSKSSDISVQVEFIVQEMFSRTVVFRQYGNSVSGASDAAWAEINVPASVFINPVNAHYPFYVVVARLTPSAGPAVQSQAVDFEIRSVGGVGEEIRLSSPADGQELPDETMLLFSWIPVGADRYKITISEQQDDRPQDVVVGTIVDASTFTYPNPPNPTIPRQYLAANRSYYWRVEGMDYSGKLTGIKSQWRSFRVRNPKLWAAPAASVKPKPAASGAQPLSLNVVLRTGSNGNLLKYNRSLWVEDIPGDLSGTGLFKDVISVESLGEGCVTAEVKESISTGFGKHKSKLRIYIDYNKLKLSEEELQGLTFFEVDIGGKKIPGKVEVQIAHDTYMCAVNKENQGEKIGGAQIVLHRKAPESYSQWDKSFSLDDTENTDYKLEMLGNYAFFRAVALGDVADVSAIGYVLRPDFKIPEIAGDPLGRNWCGFLLTPAEVGSLNIVFDLPEKPMSDQGWGEILMSLFKPALDRATTGGASSESFLMGSAARILEMDVKVYVTNGGQKLSPAPVSRSNPRILVPAVPVGDCDVSWFGTAKLELENMGKKFSADKDIRGSVKVTIVKGKVAEGKISWWWEPSRASFAPR